MYQSLFENGGLSFERLRALIEVHDAGSIAAAAPGDPVRHSLYSRQLGELSTFFGRELVRKQGRILKLTPEGVRLVELARPFLCHLQDFHAICRGQRVEFTVAAGDSLIQWLVIPRIGALLKAHPEVRFTTLSLRTNEIIRQIEDTRLNFGLVRKNAAKGMASEPLGKLTYIGVVPTALLSAKKPPTLVELITQFPLAIQITEGEFSSEVLKIAREMDANFRPGLACQSFPQTLAAVRSGRFAAIIPELAVKDLPRETLCRVWEAPLRRLERNIVLAWNPRTIKVRTHAEKILASLQTALRFK